MVDTTLLIMGCVGGASWVRDEMRRLGGQARERGIRLLGADTWSNLRAATADELACVDEVVPLDVYDPNACREWAATRPDVDGVLTIRELAVFSTAVIAKALSVAGNEPDAVRLIRNKDLCRDRLREVGFPQPVTALCSDADDAELFMRETGPGPWIVKPRNGLASIGVSVVERPKDIPAALHKFGAPPPSVGTFTASQYFLIETFVDGEEFSAEGVLIGGVPQVLALTRKTTVEGFIGLSQRVPADLDDATARAASNAVAQALTAVGITWGIFHVEFWVTESRIVLGEFHARPGGDFIHALVEYSRPGIELFGMLIDDLLGRTPEPIPDCTRSAGAEFIFIQPGRLRAVHGWEQLTRHPAVLAADLQVAPGDLIQPSTDSFTRPGVFVVGADTPAELDQLITTLKSNVTFDLD